MNINLYSRKMQKDFHEDLDCYLEVVLKHQRCRNNCQYLVHYRFLFSGSYFAADNWIHPQPAAGEGKGFGSECLL